MSRNAKLLVLLIALFGLALSITGLVKECSADEYDFTSYQLDSFNLQMDTNNRPGGTIGNFQEWQHEQNVLDNQWNLQQQLNELKEENNARTIFRPRQSTIDLYSD